MVLSLVRQMHRTEAIHFYLHWDTGADVAHIPQLPAAPRRCLLRVPRARGRWAPHRGSVGWHDDSPGCEAPKSLHLYVSMVAETIPTGTPRVHAWPVACTGGRRQSNFRYRLPAAAPDENYDRRSQPRSPGRHY